MQSPLPPPTPPAVSPGPSLPSPPHSPPPPPPRRRASEDESCDWVDAIARAREVRAPRPAPRAPRPAPRADRCARGAGAPREHAAANARLCPGALASDRAPHLPSPPSASASASAPPPAVCLLQPTSHRPVPRARVPRPLSPCIAPRQSRSYQMAVVALLSANFLVNIYGSPPPLPSARARRRRSNRQSARTTLADGARHL